MTNLLENIHSHISHLHDRIVAVVVHLNDTYIIEERPDAGIPGFPRVIATVQSLREHVRNTLGENRLLVVHSGDFLGPSRVGKRDRGRTMIKLLNQLGTQYCVLGNHEFDYGMKAFIERCNEADFEILLGNSRSSDLPSRSYALWPSEAEPLVALTGIVSETAY